jgi:hypothetical protein
MTTPFAHACHELQAYLEAMMNRFEELTQYELDTVKDGAETRSVSRVCIENMRPAIEYLQLVAERDEKRVALVTKDMFLLSNSRHPSQLIDMNNMPVEELGHSYVADEQGE